MKRRRISYGTHGVLSLALAFAGCQAEPARDEEARTELQQIAARTARLEAEIERMARRLDRIAAQAAEAASASKQAAPSEVTAVATKAPAPAPAPQAVRESPKTRESAPAPAAATTHAEEPSQKSPPAQFDEFTLKVQRALKRAGFDPGPDDGKKGPLTTKALQAFQKDNNLPVTGMADEATWALLKRYLER